MFLALGPYSIAHFFLLICWLLNAQMGVLLYLVPIVLLRVITYPCEYVAIIECYMSYFWTSHLYYLFLLFLLLRH